MQAPPCRLLRLSRDALCLVASFFEDREHDDPLRLICTEFAAISRLPQSYAPTRGPIRRERDLAALPLALPLDTCTFVASIKFDDAKARRFRGAKKLEIRNCFGMSALAAQIAPTIEQVHCTPSSMFFKQLEKSPTLHTLILEEIHRVKMVLSFPLPTQIKTLELRNCCQRDLVHLAMWSDRLPELTALNIDSRMGVGILTDWGSGLFPKVERVKWICNHAPLYMNLWTSVHTLDLVLLPFDGIDALRCTASAHRMPPNVKRVSVTGGVIDLVPFLNGLKKMTTLTLNDVWLSEPSSQSHELDSRPEPLEIIVVPSEASIVDKTALRQVAKQQSLNITVRFE